MQQQSWEESEKRKNQRRESQDKEDQSAQKVEKSHNTVFLQWFAVLGVEK